MSSSQSVVGNLAVELGLSDEQFRQAIANAQVYAERAAAQMQARIEKASKESEAQAEVAAKSIASKSRSALRDSENSTGSGFKPHGLLAISRAIDDVQYGFRGVLNNVEQIATGLGASAGVAGAATIAAVAVYAIAPAFESAYTAATKFFGTWQSEAEKAALSTQAFMGAGGIETAMARVLKNEIELLKERNALGQNWAISFSRIGDYAHGLKMIFSGDIREFDSPEDINRRLQQRRGLEAAAKAQELTLLAGEANRKAGFAQSGALAKFDLSSAQREAEALNQKLFQEAVDKFGGGKKLESRLTEILMSRGGMVRSGAQSVYGGFKAGDEAMTNEAVMALGLQSERLKIINDDYERITGSAKELQRIEERRLQTIKETDAFFEKGFNWLEKDIRDTNAFFERGFDWFAESVAKENDAKKREKNLIDRRDAVILQRNRTEILGSASEIFYRNINAGQDDPQLKELKEINEGIRKLGEWTGLG